MKNIGEKVVIITGASSGIGKATALLLASEGAWVVLAARREEKLKEIADEIIKNGAKRVLVCATDVTNKVETDRLVQKTMEEFGRIDVMINNAGLMSIAPLEQIKIDEWYSMIDINIKGVLNGIASTLPIFIQQKLGQYINLSSVAGRKVIAEGTVYCATKFAVGAITEGIREELGKFIRTTAIEPGAVDTDLIYGSDKENIENVKQLYKISIKAEDIANAIAYAISQPTEVDVNEILVRPKGQEI